MDAYARGQYGSAVAPLRAFLAAQKSDQQAQRPDVLDALFALADCQRRAVPLEAAQLSETIQYLDEYLQARPKEEKALQLQIDLRSRERNWPVVIALADQFLQVRPDDRAVLWTKAEALVKLEKPNYAGSRDTLEKLLSVAPRHVDALLKLQERKLAAGSTSAQVLADAEKLSAAHPGDAAYEAALAHACIFAAKLDKSQAPVLLKRCADVVSTAIARRPSDAPTVLALVSALDTTSRFKDSLDYLTRAADTLADPILEQVLIRRLWQCDQFDRVIARAAKSPADSVGTHSDILAFQVMSLRSLAADAPAGENRNRLLNQADATAAPLGKRNGDPASRQWSALLALEAESRPSTAPTESAAIPAHVLVKRYRDIVRMYEGNSVAIAHYGDALMSVEEDEQAAKQWRNAADLQPEWSYPYAQFAALKMRTDGLGEAVEPAWYAGIRGAGSRRIATFSMYVRFEALQNARGAEAALLSLLAEVEAFRKQNPGDEETVAVHVGLLAKLKGKDAAVSAIDAALAAKPPPRLATLLQLLNLDESEKLGTGERISAAIAKEESGQDALVVRRAQALLREDKAREGLQLLLDAQRNAKGKNQRQWMEIIALFRDRSNDPEAPAALGALSDQFPQNISVQLQVLRTPGIQRDRDVWQRVINKLKALSSDDATRWRTEQATLLLSGPATPAARKEAITAVEQVLQIAPQSSGALRLLGRALREDGQYDRALKAFEEAHRARPKDYQVTLELANARMLARKREEAKALLAEINDKPLSPQQRLSQAILYEQLELNDKAIQSLRQLPPSAARDSRLGRLLLTAGDKDEATAAFLRLLIEADAQPIELAGAADYFAASRQPEIAQKFLERLGGAGSSAVAEVLLGQHQERYGAPEGVRAHLLKATELGPRNDFTWAALAGYRLRSGDAAGAQQAIDAGLSAAGKTPVLAGLQSITQLVRKLPHPQHVSGLIAYLSVNPLQQAARSTLEALAEGQIAEAAAANDPAALARVHKQLQERLLSLANDHPTVWPIQEILIHHYLQSNVVRAGDLAWRATQNCRGEAEPARLATQAFALQRRWSRVTEAATIWRQRSGGQTVPADIYLADAEIAQRRPAVALRILEKPLQDNPLPAAGTAAASLPPQTLLELHRTLGRALLALDRPDEAIERLKPMLEIGPSGRLAWMSVASASTSSATARQWLDRVRSRIEGIPEQLSLAEAWQDSARATGDAELLKPAAAILDPLIAGEPPVEALELAGMVAHFQGDYEKAERCWRGVARARNGAAQSMNNLAYVLLIRANPKDLPEATALAEKAVAAMPEPAFLGTLARARSANGDRAAAIAGYRKALQEGSSFGHDDNVEARLGLAEELSRGSKAEEKIEARRLVSEAEAMLRNGTLQPPEIQKQLLAIKARLDVAVLGT
jgi:tetratricopeptide (TPR) repeat protein